MAVIEVSSLTKTFDGVVAVDDLSFTVGEGEIFGLLGKNGAGKTTTIEILEGFVARDHGSVSVLGVDPASGGRSWRDRLGLVLQDSTFDPLHTVAEMVELFASFFSSPRSVAETLELVGLADRATARLGRLSGGQKRRVDVALGIVGRPELLFLDEPTTGFDPSARREFWTMIEGLRETGTSIVLTTHYMEEAQYLCDRLAIMGKGRILAEGSAEALIAAAGTTSVRFLLPVGLAADQVATLLEVPVHLDGGALRAELGASAQRSLHRLLEHCHHAGLELEALEVTRANLDDVFLSVTGPDQ